MTTILNTDSLITTVDRFNDAVFLDLDWRNEVYAIVSWVSDRLGGGYAGSFAMTENDWERPFHLFIGEKITTRAGRSHVIAQETNRMLPMNFRIADLNNLDTFADCNRILFEDEEHRNPMDDAELRERMNG